MKRSDRVASLDLGVKVEFVLKSLTGPHPFLGLRFTPSASQRRGKLARRTGRVAALVISAQLRSIGDGGFASRGG